MKRKHCSDVAVLIDAKFFLCSLTDLPVLFGDLACYVLSKICSMASMIHPVCDYAMKFQLSNSNTNALKYQMPSTSQSLTWSDHRTSRRLRDVLHSTSRCSIPRQNGESHVMRRTWKINRFALGLIEHVTYSSIRMAHVEQNHQTCIANVKTRTLD